MTVVRSRSGLVRLLATAGATAWLVGLGVVVAASPAAGQQDCAEPGQEFTELPWPQRMLAPERVWPFSTGEGVTVAVVASGVDADHPLLAGRVQTGFDALTRRDGADDDCLGLGTQVAGVIAGQPSASTAFAGIAPGVSILPVRVIDTAFGRAAELEPAVLARGIAWAAERADVIAVPVASYRDHPAVRAAVAGALAEDVIVVAAAGDLGGDGAGNPTPYPAAYDGVLGVGAVDRSGNRWTDSGRGDYVDLVAPGVDVVAPQRKGGMVGADGTGVAAGFVAAAVALVRAEAPDRPSADAVRRLLDSAAPAPLGPDSPEYGRGVLNPYAAVHDRLVENSPAPLPALVIAEPGHEPTWIRSRTLALRGTAVAVVAVLMVIAVAVALPRGRRRWWRSTVAAPPPDNGEPAEPGPPLPLFDG